MFSCSKSEQKQLNTWVSFQSAEEPLLGQFSVSGNKYGAVIQSVRVGQSDAGKAVLATGGGINPSERRGLPANQ
ncbi:hypothetical protein CJF41_10405 [Pseudomonas lundensis]|nr:hypothetical protein CJF41_10405 [Pseudomonas lundensis]